MENEKLNNLIKIHDNYILNGNYQDCLITCFEIIQILIPLQKNIQYNILSQILLSKNQYLYVIFGIFQYLIHNKYIISFDNETQIKYYKLLLLSLKNNKDTSKDFILEKNRLISILEKDNLNIIEIEREINSIQIVNISNNHHNLSKLYNGELILTTTASKNSYMILNDQSIITQNITSPLEKSITAFNFEEKKEKNNQLNNNINNQNQNENSKKYKPNRKLPFIIINFVANFNSNQVIEKLENLMENINFFLLCHIKETQFENISVYEYKENNCLKNIFGNCFQKKNKENNNNIQFHLTTILKRDENDFSSGVNSFVHDKYERTLLIRTIQGNEKKTTEKIFKILKHFSLLVSKIKIIQKSKHFNNYNIEQYIKQYLIRKKAELYKEKNLPFNKDYYINFNNSHSRKKQSDNILLEEESFVEKSNNEVGKTLEVYKLLSEKNYGLGKTMSDFIENFKKEYLNINNISESIDTNEIMKTIVKVTEDCVSTFNSSYNIGNENNNLNLNFRESTEQFLWNKIYFILFDIYKKKFYEKNIKFLQKQKEIKNNFNIDQIFEHLDIKKKFRGEEQIPFKVTIELINKIEYEQVPKKKFETLTQSALELRNSILDYTKGKTELESMDDELPLCMYLVTQIKVSNFLAELNLVQDYIQYSLRDKMIQNKVVTNLISSALYIMDSW